MTINQYASDHSGSDYLYYLLGDTDGEDKDEEIAMIFMGAAAAADSIYPRQ